MLVAQIEHVHISTVLTIQQLTFMLQPSQVTLRVLEKLCLRLKNCIGGQLLDQLYTLMLEQGDVKSYKLHWHLLTKAFEPFLKMLSSWLFRSVGSINKNNCYYCYIYFIIYQYYY